MSGSRSWSGLGRAVVALGLLMASGPGCGEPLSEDDDSVPVDDDTSPDDDTTPDDDTADDDSAGDDDTAVSDADGDGSPDDVDCDDEDPEVHPGAQDAACDGIDQDCDGADLGAVDGDGDGVDACTDCDDADAGVLPGTAEVCDGADQDCDGAVDDGFDLDGDAITSCGGDCDDADPAVYPGAAEACNGVDDDCDGEADAGLLLPFYADADGDGFGDPAAEAWACTRPEGHVEDATDCDDAADETFPGAPEQCNGVDDDCDGEVDTDGTVFTFYLDVDDDGFGVEATTVVDCAWPDGYAHVSGDCDDADPGVNPAAVEVCDFADQDCDGTADEGLDADGDGFTPCNGDCDDGAAWIAPDVPEVCDGNDQDCDGVADDGFDLDGDGYATCFGDCDDAHADAHPGGTETCDGLDNDCDGEADEEFDGDLDGYTPCAGDCDDGSAAVHPGALEVCNDLDDDCDGGIDDDGDLLGYYQDADGDGYGADGTAILACEPPEGYVGEANDCDDSDPGVSPDAGEVCDGVDQDCDGEVDDGVLDDWFLDTDGDGYGGPAGAVVACEGPPGYVAEGGDCDETDPAVGPGAAELCDGQDQDCDGLVDDGVAFVTWYLDGDGDAWGDPAMSVTTCNGGPLGWIDDGGDCDDGDPALHPGAAEDCEDGIDQDCDGGIDDCGPLGEISLGDAEARVLGLSSSEYAGFAVAIATDLDGDGRDDVAIGAYGNDTGGGDSGRAYLFRGPIAGSLDVGDADARLSGEVAYDYAGIAVASAGDQDGDGHGDLLVGAPGSDYGGAGFGSVYLLRGPVEGAASLSAASARIDGDAGDGGFGVAMAAAGDVNGDGYPDLAIGAPEAGEGGKVHVVLGPVEGVVDLAASGASLLGIAAGDRAGSSVAALGDVNGDGYGDLLIGAPGRDGSGADAGAAYVVHGPVVGDASLADAAAVLAGEGEEDLAGTSVAAADVDGDGATDFWIGAPGSARGGSDAGAAFLVLGPASGTISLGSADAMLLGAGNYDDLGTRVAAGDVNGDGYADLLASAPGSNTGGADAGEVYLVYGSDAPDGQLAPEASFYGESAYDEAGSGLASGGDVDGDGYHDVLVGARGHDGGATAAGAAYLVLGGSREDFDSDGFTVLGGDCDDHDPGTYPGAVETCDGRDEDCSGYADDPFELDLDGWTTCAGDCQDADAAVNPGVDEACNGVDDDCDGRTDEGFEADGDGYATCVGDCDDADPRLNPGATEVCDGVDQDCDGVLDGGFDLDGDGFTTCAGDCDDADGVVFPGVPEACDGVDQDCDGIADDGFDTDADGVTTCGGDCDDADAGVHPGAAERCDGLDDDCDGTPDEGVDGDGDGDGFTECGGDCDDARADVLPGQAEVCDGADQDCDGVADEGLDADGDGATSCGGDCDDGDPGIGPGEDEDCDDGVDQDCDGIADECAPAGVVDLSMADAERRGDDGSDTAGYDVAGAGDVNGDGFDDVLIGAPHAERVGVDQGMVYLILGPIAGGADLATADAILEGDNGSDYAGYSVASAGDLDADGFSDLLVGAYGHDGGGNGSGAAFVVYGPVAGTLDLGLADARLTGEDPNDSAGMGVAAAGDVDGDGFGDVLVSAPGDDTGGNNAGAVYLVRGPVSAIDLSAADAKIVGSASTDQLQAVASGDFNGDGFSDLLVGAPNHDAGGTDAGAAWVVYGPVFGTFPLAFADAKLVGESANDYAGFSVACAGDVDGDGFDDVLVGAYGSDAGGNSSGAAYLLYGPLWGEIDLSAADVRLVGENPSDIAGRRVSGAGDVDGDGLADVLVAAYGNDAGGPDAGAVYLLYGPVTADRDLSLADTKWVGETSGDLAGMATAGVGDVDGDGYGDVVVGAPQHDEGGPDVGSAYLLRGGQRFGP